MSVKATVWAWDQHLKSTHKLVLLSLADRADEDFICFPSAKRLEENTCLNIKTVYIAITAMIKQGIITDTGERKGVRQQVKVLKLNVHLKISKNGSLKDQRYPKTDLEDTQKRIYEDTQKRVAEPLISLNLSEEPLSPAGNVSEYSEEFEKIWKFYNKGNKKKSFKVFQKLTQTQMTEMYSKVRAYVDSTPDKKYRKGFEVYLNPANEHWNDEVLTVSNTGGNGYKDQMSKMNRL